MSKQATTDSVSKKKTASEPLAAASTSPSPTQSAASHQFWSRQPVVSSAYCHPTQPIASPAALNDVSDPTTANSSTAPSTDNDQVEEGVIDPSYLSTLTVPLSLPSGFEWSDLAVQTAESDDLSALHSLLRQHYVEDSALSARVDYSPASLLWALTSPNHSSRYHVAVRLSASKKLVGFICGTRQLVRIRSHVGVTLQISFLCVHSKLRRQRLAPVLIKEITRRISVHDTVKHAVYTASVLIHQPLSHCTYYHRPLNVPSLVQAGFIPHPALLSTPQPRTEVAKTAAYKRFVKRHALPAVGMGGLPELAAMREEDVAAVHSLLTDYLAAFQLVPLYDQDEVRHWFLPRPGVVYSYVVYDQGKLAAFVSFNAVPRLHHYSSSTPIPIRTANASYHVCRSSTITKAAVLKEVLSRAQGEGFDVYSALDMDGFW